MTQAEMVEMLSQRLDSFEASIRTSIQSSFRDVFDRIHTVSRDHAECRHEMGQRITAMEEARGIRRRLGGWVFKGAIAVGSALAGAAGGHFIPRMFGG